MLLLLMAPKVERMASGMQRQADKMENTKNAMTLKKRKPLIVFPFSGERHKP
jgi:hypothetical protein